MADYRESWMWQKTRVRIYILDAKTRLHRWGFFNLFDHAMAQAERSGSTIKEKDKDAEEKEGINFYLQLYLIMNHCRIYFSNIPWNILFFIMYCNSITFLFVFICIYIIFKISNEKIIIYSRQFLLNLKNLYRYKRFEVYNSVYCSTRSYRCTRMRSVSPALYSSCKITL
jgi:hypothetical protein